MPRPQGLLTHVVVPPLPNTGQARGFGVRGADTPADDRSHDMSGLAVGETVVVTAQGSRHGLICEITKRYPHRGRLRRQFYWLKTVTGGEDIGWFEREEIMTTQESGS